MKGTRKTIALTAGAFFILALALASVQAIWRPFSTDTPLRLRGHPVGFDIHYPDAIIDSAALSRLPADMIRLPLLRALLTRDFVDYYESGATRLSVEGTLRRLAFEHNLDWRDELIRLVFDEPSRVLLWRSPGGRLGYWVMMMRRNSLAKLIQSVGNVAAGDRQLSKVAMLLNDVPVYALRPAVGHTLLFAAKDDHLLIMSEPGILLDPNSGAPISDRAQALARMLADGGNQAIRAYHLDRSESANKHRLVLSVNYLSFAYQTFFPDITALRFDCAAPGKANNASNPAGGNSQADNPVKNAAATDADETWSTSALIDPAHLSQRWNNADVWRALPANAAACASLPVNWSEAADVLSKLGDAAQAAAKVLREQVTGPAGVCWYAKSTLAAPVFIAQLNPEAARDPARPAEIKSALASAFSALIGAYEVKAGNATDGGAHASGQSGYHRLPVETRELPGGITLWTRPVSARSGTALSASSPYASRLSAPRYFPVALAFAHGYIVFSPDARLVDDTLAVLDKRYPAVADMLEPPRLSTVVALITPAAAAALIEREAGRALPEDQEAIFRDAARTHLLPKLRAAAEYPPLTLSLPARLPASAGWVPVEWHFETPRGEGPRGDGSGFDGPDGNGKPSGN